MTAELVIGIMVAGLGFFLVRFINRSDEFQKNTATQISALKFKLKEQSEDLSYQMKIIQKDVKEARLEPHVKRDIKKLSIQLDLLQKEIDTKIRPNLSKPDENYGRILVLEKKILTMFKTVEVLAERLPKSHPK